MDEQVAVAAANALGGDTWDSGGNVWLVLFRRADGKTVALSDECVCVYENDEALLTTAEPQASILLR